MSSGNNLIKKIGLKITDYIFLMRLPLLIPVWTVITVGWITGGGATVKFPVLLKNLFTVNPYMLWASLGFSLIVSSIYIMNQIADIESDTLNNKLFILPQKLVSLKEAWVLALLSAAAGILISVFYLNLIFTLLFVIGLFLGILYNLPPFSMKNRPIAGIVLNFLGHGIVTYLVGWYAARPQGNITEGLLSSLSLGFANAAVFVTSTIPDRKGDEKVGKRTIAVAAGYKVSSVIATLLCIGSFLTAFLIKEKAFVMIITSFVSMFVFGSLIFSKESKDVFKSFRWPVAILAIISGVLYPPYAAAVLFTLVASRVYYKYRFNYEYPTILKCKEEC